MSNLSYDKWSIYAHEVTTKRRRAWEIQGCVFSPMSCKVGPVLHHPSAQKLRLISEVNCIHEEDKGPGPRHHMQLPIHNPHYSLTLVHIVLPA